jgi:hypothetical protein
VIPAAGGSTVHGEGLFFHNRVILCGNLNKPAGEGNENIKAHLRTAHGAGRAAHKKKSGAPARPAQPNSHSSFAPQVSYGN